MSPALQAVSCIPGEFFLANLPGESIGDGSCFSQESGNELQDNSVNFLPLLVFSGTCIRESIFSECQDAFVRVILACLYIVSGKCFVVFFLNKVLRL